MKQTLKLNPYREMPPYVRTQFIAELLHCIQSSVICYEAAHEIIELGREKDLFKGVKIGLELTAVENSEI